MGFVQRFKLDSWCFPGGFTREFLEVFQEVFVGFHGIFRGFSRVYMEPKGFSEDFHEDFKGNPKVFSEDYHEVFKGNPKGFLNVSMGFRGFPENFFEIFNLHRCKVSNRNKQIRLLCVS